MSQYSYLHIALRGEIQGATRTIYSYAASGSEVDPQWDSTMVEPGAAVKRFLNVNDCYILQSSSLGHYFSLITRNALNPERGYMMISILVDNGCALTGRQLINAFLNLRKTLVEDENLTDEAVDEALANALVPVEPLRLEAWEQGGNQAPVETMKEAAYRTYISNPEFESILSFPHQPDYEAYRCIIVISASASLRPGVKMPRITVPIRKLYSVVCPEGVTASSQQVYDGDRLEFLFTKEGFAPHKELVIVGTPSAFTKYEGSTLLVRSAAQTGIRFERRIPLRVVSAKGTALNGYTVTLNGRSVNTMEPFVELYEKDLQPGAEVEIIVRSNNYRPQKLKRSTEEMLATEELEFIMQPVEQGVTLRLDFGDGRVFEQHLSIEKNTPEYNRLHSGNFHGFRAHRQVTDDDSEVYNVDVRITSRPVAPNFESSSNHHDKANRNAAEGQGKAPVFENVSADALTDEPKIDSTLPTAADSADRRDESSDRRHRYDAPQVGYADAGDASDGGESTDDDDEIISGIKRRKKPLAYAAGALVVVAVLGVALWQMLGSGDNAVSSDSELVEPELVADSVATAAPAPVVMTPEESEDVAYLNSSDVWAVDKVKSAMGRNLMEAILAGDIDAVVGNDYFAVAGRATNSKANLVADLIWRAKGSFSDKSNRRILRSAVQNGRIELKSLSENLAKRRPSEKENTAPRPSK